MIRVKSCDSCPLFVEFLCSCDEGTEKSAEYAYLSKKKLDKFLSTFQVWTQRQCLCCLRDSKNYDQFYWVVQSIIIILVTKLKDYKGQDEITCINICTTKDITIEDMTPSELKTEQVNNISSNESTESSVVEEERDIWLIHDLEKILHFLGKVLLLNFPLYVAYKQNVQNKTEELTPLELTSLKDFCDLHDLEVPIHLLRNVSLFCRNDGVQAMTACFEHESLPVPVAHAMIAAGCNLKLWLNYHSIMQLFVPLRTNILRYMCHMPDKHLRTQALKSMADYMWSAVKDPMNTAVNFDKDGMELAFKYFTSTTLTMRLAGISQINSHINLFNDMCNNENSDVESIGQMISSWLIENNIISHIFGPNLHVEVIKQSHVVLTFLAMENKITNEHIDIMWQAGQLKHCSKHVYDLLLPLIKNLEVGPMLHLYKLLSKLEPKEHTEQTLYLASALIKFVWSSSAAYLEAASKPVHRTPSTDMSFEPTNSEVESSGSLEKSESDTSFGPAPRKRRKLRNSNIPHEETTGDTDESLKMGEFLECEENSTNNNNHELDSKNRCRKLKRVKEDSSDDDEGCIEKNTLQGRPANIPGKVICSDKDETESDSDTEIKQNQEVPASVLRQQYLQAVQETLKHAEIEGIQSAIIRPTLHPVCEMMDDMLSGDDMSISSRISNKSEKNMADFDGEDSGCDEEIAHITPTNRTQDSRQLEFQKRIANKMSFAPGSQEVVSIISQFDLENVCKPGNTLLWDLIQDDKISQLGEGLAQEAEKALCNLLCGSTERLIRMKFIEGCLDNLAKNTSVLISLKLLPKLFSSFRGSPMSPSEVALWAQVTHGMTQRFFQNLKTYVSKDPQIVDIQIRLQFLTHIYSSGCLPDSITLTIQDIDTLWDCLTSRPVISDEFYSWLLRQAKSKEQHALGLEALKHLYTKKLPTLPPETISMVALSLYQQLCNMARTVSCSATENSSREGDVIAMDHLWKIALRANITDVSFAAIQYLNNYYIGHRLSHVKDFIFQCMAHIGEATNALATNTSSSLLYIQRALILLKTHLDTFRRKYTYHLRRWTLEGKGIEGQTVTSHVIGDKGDIPYQITVKPASQTEKLCLSMLPSDYVADFRAEVSFWWEKNQKKQDVNQGVVPRLLSNEGPIRIIANGQEITPEFDEKMLQEVGFKENQLVYISVGAVRGRKKDMECPSSLPPPPQHCLPTLMLLTPQYFEQLFTLMNTLSTMSTPNNNLHMKAQVLSRRVWDILTLLPTNPTLLLGFQQVKTLPRLKELLDPVSPHKLMYSLHIIENLIKHRSTSPTPYITTGSDNWVKPAASLDGNWIEMFVQNGGLEHLFNIFISGALKPTGGGGNEWQQDCLACLLKLLCEISVTSNVVNTAVEVKPKAAQYPKADKSVVQKLSQAMMALIDVKSVINQLSSVLGDASLSRDTNSYRTSFWGRAQVIQYALTFFVSWSHTDPSVCTSMCSHPQFSTWLSRLILEEPDPSIRSEVSVLLYKLDKPDLLLPYLVNFLPTAVAMRPSVPNESIQPMIEDGKEPYGPACRDYFWLLCRLVDNLIENPKKGKMETCAVDLNSLVKCVYHSVLEREIFETRHNTVEDHGLIGLLNLMANILKHNPICKAENEADTIINEIFNLVFALPSPENLNVPKCKSFAARSATYDVLVEMVKGSISNYTSLYEKLLQQHEPGPHSPYPWDYWPHEDGRAECGYVGLTNLGATCYMASCVQHLFMMPYVREQILEANTEEASKHHSTLRELQRMFAFLLESERKAYNPTSFCRAYTMDHQPLNTGEQKDMAEFFIDLVSKLEEMTPQLKTVVKSQFGGIISNNVVSLDCEHVSRTLEEFYTVRCQVANMRNIFDSLDEVTVKDTLEGDNMYTCSQCGKKVRAEKRACFKKLPQVLCFNTMRYTFNMATMQKEKVNTHFSFPFELDMSGYVEKHLMPQHYQEDKLAEKETIQKGSEEHFGEEFKYGLIGVTVHTGTADGGHYYCFIRDTFKDKWFLFNDAEVKPFEPSQIPAECFGGEMTSKTYDSLTDKFMDLSFEKTNSAYMLFYERGASKTKLDGVKVQPSSIKLSCDLEQWIWEDNVHFIRDKNIFDHSYFQFIWQMCGHIPHTLDNPNVIKEMATKLLTTFFLETFIHAKEKPTMVQWVELLTKQFTSSYESGEWFLNHMALNNWWSMQILIKCPNQMVRQMFHRLCIHVIQGLRVKHAPLYLKVDCEGKTIPAYNAIGEQSCVTRFIKMLLSLLESGAKYYMRNLTEYFALLNDFCKMGEEEMKFLISINAISTMISFYMGNRPKEYMDATSEEEEGEETLPSDKYKPASLERMITLIATLVEKSRGPDHNLHLSPADYAVFTGGKCFPFLSQQIKDGINLYQTRNLILSLCKWNDRMAAHIVSMIFASIHKNVENSNSYFKLITYLTESGSSPGLPCFTQLIISHVWEVVSVCPLSALDWLATQAQRSKLTHSWLLQSMDTWVEHYLVAHTNQRVRSSTAYLLVCMVPNLTFRQVYRSGRMAKELHNMSPESLLILHQVYSTLLRMLKSFRQYTDIAVHGASKLHIYFTLLNYFAYSRTEKLMFGPYLHDLWQLFHPKLSEPGISVHLNKQALLHFWYSVSSDCPENVQLILQNAHIVKNLAYNYILADHDDQEVVAFNRTMLPAYYGLLRLCCQQSRSFTRQLATHQNITWAFKNIALHPTQYHAAVEELFKLMHLFVNKYPDSTEQEITEINNFRKQTLQLFLQVLDGRSCFTTLITAIKILAETVEDKLHILYHGGLQMCFESFHTLHAMYHEATACHVSGDLVELMTIIQDLSKTVRQVREPKDIRSVLLSCKDWVETIRKIPTLLNTYNSSEIRNSAIDLMKELLLAAPDEVMQILVPLLSHCHVAFQENTNPIPMGSYYPRQRVANTSIKSITRPLRPMLQMGVSHSQLELAKGIDPEYDQALSAFYSPYHGFIDVMCRLAINNDCMSEALVNLSAMVGYEAVPLHFTFFPKLWLDIHHAQNVDRKYIITLANSSYFIDYVEAALVDWRTSLNISIIFDFLSIFFPKVASQVLTDQTCTLMESIVSNLATNLTRITFTSPQYKLIGDLRALALVYSKDLPVVPPPELLPTVQQLSDKLKQVYSVDSESSSTSTSNWMESLQSTVNSLLASLQEKSNREDHP